MNRGVGLLEVGASQRHVPRKLGVSQSVVARMWSRYQMNGNVISRYRGGRQRATTQAQDRFIVVQARRHRFMNATALKMTCRMHQGFEFQLKPFETDCIVLA
ncbi:hypothetical protein DPMN_113276 [Dreissena polymorpha]|uniref:Paired domain-containing protein n=1 Tax=Dreissena polymorpha TaxID=45954 RepID=A0A9D4KI50_DREPO|nr:hypothetical protein DPMN_113276 [Dreissena polymorpha]